MNETTNMPYTEGMFSIPKGQLGLGVLLYWGTYAKCSLVCFSRKWFDIQQPRPNLRSSAFEQRTYTVDRESQKKTRYGTVTIFSYSDWPKQNGKLIKYWNIIIWFA